MKRLLFLFAVVLSLFTVACGSKDKSEIKALMNKEVKAMEQEDIETIMNCLVGLDSETRAATRKTYEDLFKKYDISYKLISLKIISCDGDEAVIEVIVEAKKVRGPAFQDNRTTSRSRFKKTASGWKDAGTIKIVKFESL